MKRKNQRKMKKTKNLKELSKEDMKNKMEELRKDLMRFNAQISTGTPPENPGQVRNVKRTIARIKTFLKNKKKEDKEKK